MQSFARQVGRVVGKTAVGARHGGHHHPHVPAAVVPHHDHSASPVPAADDIDDVGGRGAFSDAEIDAVRHDLFDQESEWLGDSGSALAALSGDQHLEEKLDLEQNFLVNEASLSMGVRLAKIPEVRGVGNF